MLVCLFSCKCLHNLIPSIGLPSLPSQSPHQSPHTSPTGRMLRHQRLSLVLVVIITDMILYNLWWLRIKVGLSLTIIILHYKKPVAWLTISRSKIKCPSVQDLGEISVSCLILRSYQSRSCIFFYLNWRTDWWCQSLVNCTNNKLSIFYIVQFQKISFPPPPPPPEGISSAIPTPLLYFLSF